MKNLILIVEDNKDLAQLLEKILQFQGYITQVAHNGEDGWSKVVDEKPKVVVTDVNIPKMNGFKLLQKIKKHYKNIEVIIITADSDTRDGAEAIEMGAFGFIHKPFDNQDLIDLIEKVFNNE